MAEITVWHAIHCFHCKQEMARGPKPGAIGMCGAVECSKAYHEKHKDLVEERDQAVAQERAQERERYKAIHGLEMPASSTPKKKPSTRRFPKLGDKIHD